MKKCISVAAAVLLLFLWNTGLSERVATGGVVRVRGDVTSKQGVKTYAVAIFGEGEITLYGDLIHYSGAALVKDGGTLKISGDFRNMSSLANVTHTENGGTIEEISADE